MQPFAEITSFIHSFIHLLSKAHNKRVYARLRYSSGNKHLQMNQNNKNTERNFKTQNTLVMPKDYQRVIIRV